MIETGLIRAVRLRQESDDDLVEFVDLLMEALTVPDVADAVRAALDLPSPPARTAAPSPSGRGRTPGRVRGRRET